MENTQLGLELPNLNNDITFRHLEKTRQRMYMFNFSDIVAIPKRSPDIS